MIHWSSDLYNQVVMQVAHWSCAARGEGGEAYTPIKVEVLQYATRKEARITIDDLDLQVRIVVNGEILMDTTPDYLKELASASGIVVAGFEL